MTILRTPLRFATLAAALLAASLPARAGVLSDWSWNGSFNKVALSGTAQFSAVQAGIKWDLVIDLGNNAAALPNAPGQILTALYFNVTGQTGALGMASAVASGGLFKATGQTQAVAGTLNTNICAPGKGGTAPTSGCAAKVAGGWEAGYSATGLKSAAATHWGIGTAGLGVFQSTTANVGNANDGLAPARGDGTGTGLAKQVPFVDGQAVFTLSGLSSDLVAVSNVVALYGTGPSVVLTASQPSSSQPNVIPEPGSLLLLGLGLAGLLAARRRR